ncbi:MAG: hypothetical protein ACFFBD_16130 [Candidatus Hodarchaeota archaeon]
MPANYDDKPINTLKNKISVIVHNKQLSTEEKIRQLNHVHEEIEKHSKRYLNADLAKTHVDNAIEAVFGSELRRLNAIREQNLERVNLDDIEILKDGYALLFRLIDNTLSWNPEKKNNLEGVINRASLRAMLIDPAVSVKTKQDIMDKWEDFM